MALNSTTLKVCEECGEVKALSDFFVDFKQPDGNDSFCIPCRKAEWSNFREVLKKYKRLDLLEQQKIRLMRWKRKNPHKVKAHIAVKNAVREGKLFKPRLCTECKSGGWIQAHHTNYARPLEVVWLCKSCHQKAHNFVPFGTWEKVNGEWLQVNYK